ncbi:MAG TPA: SGNH/GDSL hydrolase family protein [Frateuria sp.]|uniref:SGNH/GDSL hydrolase family protein n=1 Tax=Frateuria sp. TaxID=2211372 RepID=UPI002DE34D5C|nr:SGNH/GDSL hydrolase family protein [Frateuria sp.]
MSLHYLALGDSYTIGEAVPAAGRWPAQLVARLREGGVAVDDPQIVAVTGWTTDELSSAMDAASFDPPYGLVTLLIGVNNQYRGRDAGEYRDDFARLLRRAIGLAGHASRVVVVSIPDWGVTRFAHEQARDGAQIAEALDAYNAIARDEAGRAGARWVDITPISRRHPELVAEDGLHPSAQQYALWTEAILPVAAAAVK